jgi:hypothetical protein
MLHNIQLNQSNVDREKKKLQLLISQFMVFIEAISEVETDEI